MTFSCALEAFRLANERAGSIIFEYATVSPEGRVVTMDGGATLNADLLLADAPMFDITFVLSSLNAVEYRNSRLEGWLRVRARQGGVIAPLGCATVLAAQAGLLDGHRCVTHWTLYDRFAIEFPRVRTIQGLYSIDGRILTAAGGISAFDLGLALVGRNVEAAAIAQEAEIALHRQPRGPAEQQRAAITWRYGIQDERLARVIQFMEEQITGPLALADLAAVSGLSGRQVERMCLKHVGRRPMALYQEIRLRHAQSLLRTTASPVAQVALACGFADASHFTRHYKALFGETPSFTRRAAQGGRSPHPHLTAA